MNVVTIQHVLTKLKKKKKRRKRRKLKGKQKSKRKSKKRATRNSMKRKKINSSSHQRVLETGQTLRLEKKINAKNGRRKPSPEKGHMKKLSLTTKSGPKPNSWKKDLKKRQDLK